MTFSGSTSLTRILILSTHYQQQKNLIALPLALILVFSPREVMSVFGSKFVADGVPVLIVLTAAQFINCITGAVGVTLNMMGK